MKAVAEAFPQDLVRQMIEAGVHFGHRVAKWNPKMRDYILTKRNFIHIIDLRETVKGLIKACHFLESLGERGLDVLIVGTKRQGKETVRETAVASGMHFVCERWLGGTLTNYRTIRSRLKRLEELEDLESSGTLAQFSKKFQVRLQREKEKIFRNLEGIRNMEKLPGAIMVVDANRESIALKEAETLRVPTLAVIDTDSDPDLVDICVPANDDAVRSLKLVLGVLGDAYARGKARWDAAAAERAKSAPAERPMSGPNRGQGRPTGPRQGGPQSGPQGRRGGRGVKRFNAEEVGKGDAPADKPADAAAPAPAAEAPVAEAPPAAPQEGTADAP